MFGTNIVRGAPSSVTYFIGGDCFNFLLDFLPFLVFRYAVCRTPCGSVQLSVFLPNDSSLVSALESTADSKDIAEYGSESQQLFWLWTWGVGKTRETLSNLAYLTSIAHGRITLLTRVHLVSRNA